MSRRYEGGCGMRKLPPSYSPPWEPEVSLVRPSLGEILPSRQLLLSFGDVQIFFINFYFIVYSIWKVLWLQKIDKSIFWRKRKFLYPLRRALQFYYVPGLSATGRGESSGFLVTAQEVAPKASLLFTYSLSAQGRFENAPCETTAEATTHERGVSFQLGLEG